MRAMLVQHPSPRMSLAQHNRGLPAPDRALDWDGAVCGRRHAQACHADAHTLVCPAACAAQAPHAALSMWSLLCCSAAFFHCSDAKQHGGSQV